MTDIEKLAMLKALIGVSDSTQDTVLTVYLTLAKGEILRKAFPYDPSQTIVPAQYDTLQCEIAAYLWNKRGAEGQISHSENGISRQYENGGVPDSLLKSIVPYCGTMATEG